MSQKRESTSFSVEFVYTKAVLDDFESLYLQKKETPVATRVVLGALGVVGAVYFGLMIYRDGLQLTRVGYLIICSLMMLVAFARSGRRPDDTLAKYRKYYQDKSAAFTIDDNGVEMKLEGQKNFARSKFKEIYGLYDTDLSFYFVIKGKAYYIIPKAAFDGGQADDLVKFMQRKCAKRFQHYDVARK